MYLTHYGAVENIDIHLDQLKMRLLTWSGWMKKQFDLGAETAEVTKAFEKFVSEELKVANLDKQTLLAYEFANPAWMSVAGLMRYWKKKAS